MWFSKLEKELPLVAFSSKKNYIFMLRALHYYQG
jgi:hypothetical protein